MKAGVQLPHERVREVLTDLERSQKRLEVAEELRKAVLFFQSAVWDGERKKRVYRAMEDFRRWIP